MSPSPARDPAIDEIQAEIADHLATAAESLEARGATNAEAQRRAAAHFGDARQIARRCYWIKQGETLMFRAAVIVLLVGLALALGVVTFSSLRAQRQMSQQMAALAEQLKAVADQQRTAAPPPVAPAEPKVLEITGRAFRGSPDKPAAHTRLTIIDVKDGSKVRSIATDSDGNFISGPLGGGEFSLLAETDKKVLGGRYNEKVQSEPIGVYPGVAVPPQQFDVQYHPAAVTISTSRPLPKVTVDDRYTIDTRLMIRVYCPEDRDYLWISENERPLSWPVYCRHDQHPDMSRPGTGDRGREIYDLLASNDLAAFGQSRLAHELKQFPAGKLQVAAAVIVDMIPVDFARPEIPELPRPVTAENREQYDAAQQWMLLKNRRFESSSPFPASRTFKGRSADTKPTLDDDSYFWQTKGLGLIWLRHLQGPEAESKPPRPHPIAFGWLNFGGDSIIDAAAEKVTQLNVEIATDVVSRVQELVDSTTDPTKFAEATLGDREVDVARMRAALEAKRSPSPEFSPLFRPCKITIAGTKPLPAADVKSGQN